MADDLIERLTECLGENVTDGMFCTVRAGLLREAADALSRAEAERDAMRESHRNLHRRCQEAESALPEYKRILAIPPDGDGARFVSGNLGRVLLSVMCQRQQEQLERAEADARRYRLIRDCSPEVFNEICASLYSGGEELDKVVDAAMGGGEELK